jgi:hypothetical protein
VQQHQHDRADQPRDGAPDRAAEVADDLRRPARRRQRLAGEAQADAEQGAEDAPEGVRFDERLEHVVDGLESLALQVLLRLFLHHKPVIQLALVLPAGGVAEDFPDVVDEAIDLLVERAVRVDVHVRGERADDVTKVSLEPPRLLVAVAPQQQEGDDVDHADEADDPRGMVQEPLHGVPCRLIGSGGAVKVPVAIPLRPVRPAARTRATGRG